MGMRIIIIEQMADGAQTLRSRLYRLEAVNGEENWVERGEGYPEFKREDSLFRLRYYSLPTREVLYDITVDTNIQFQRSDNGIQWTQVKENEVMALSFKEQFSANAFWQLIEEYQRKYAISVPAAEGIYFYFEYKVPDPTPWNLDQVLQELESIPEKERHQRVASIFLTKRDLLPRLLGVFKRVEEANEVPKLQTMFQVMRILFNASNQQLYYELMCNESIYGVLGILEYDANFRSKRPHHRDFVRSNSRLLEVVPFNNHHELLNLIVFTFRLEYVRECVLFPYLDDNGFGSSGCIIRNNYKKIFNHIFNPRRRDFINSLYDLLRHQKPPAFNFLRELFRIARIHYMPQIYQHIADRDTFDIFLRNLRDLLVQPEPQPQPPPKRRKCKPEEMEEIVQACLQVFQQYMEHEPHHLRNYLSSEGEKVAKYPSFEFLLEQFQAAPTHISAKLGIIIKVLLGGQTHALKQTFKAKIIAKFLEKETAEHTVKWLPIFAQILLPLNAQITQNLAKLVEVLVAALNYGSKGQQIYHISVLKALVHSYLSDQALIESLLIPKARSLVDVLWKNRGRDGIRVSGILAILVPLKYHSLAREMTRVMREISSSSGLMLRYVEMVEFVSERKEIVLPSSLKRDCLDRALDEENFEKLSKKIKID